MSRRERPCSLPLRAIHDPRVLVILTGRDERHGLLYGLNFNNHFGELTITLDVLQQKVRDITADTVGPKRVHVGDFKRFGNPVGDRWVLVKALHEDAFP